MKKLTLLTVLLLALGLSMGFAQELKTSATLSGSATATWGINLNTMDTGFSNSAAAALTLNLIPADQSFTKAGEGAVYGSITISNVELYWSDAAAEVFGPADTDVAAKIVAGDLSVTIYTFPTFSYAYAGYVPLWAASAGYATTGSVTPSATSTGGITIGYALGTLGSVAIKVASNTSWTAAPTNAYIIGADLTLTPMTGLTTNVGGFYDLPNSYAGFGFKNVFTAAGATITVGVDGAYSAGLSYDASVAVAYSFMEAKDTITLSGFYDNNSELDIGLLFADAGGFVPNLAFSLGAYLYDLIHFNTNSIAIGESGSYKHMLDDTNYVTPYEKLYFNLNGNQMYLNAGLTIAIFPKTTFTIDFAGGVIGYDNNIDLVATNFTDSMILTVGTTVTY